MKIDRSIFLKVLFLSPVVLISLFKRNTFHGKNFQDRKKGRWRIEKGPYIKSKDPFND